MSVPPLITNPTTQPRPQQNRPRDDSDSYTHFRTHWRSAFHPPPFPVSKIHINITRFSLEARPPSISPRQPLEHPPVFFKHKLSQRTPWCPPSSFQKLPMTNCINIRKGNQNSPIPTGCVSFPALPSRPKSGNQKQDS
jgi:hypothetical protein